MAGTETAPPGRGKFLTKVGGRPGIPVHVALTDTELALNDINKRWHHHPPALVEPRIGEAL